MPFFDLAPDVLKTYRSAVTVPDDYEQFWQETLGEARAVPLDLRLEEVDVGLPLVQVYDASFAGFGGHRVKGWLIRPRTREARASACVVKFIGYNGGRAFPHEHLLWPATGRSVFVMDTRGQGGGWSPGATPDPVGSEPSQAGFMTKGISDPRTYFYRRVFTDAVRAVEAARAHAEIDPARIAVVGGSQGGGISLAVAGLDPTIKAVMPDVPFLCDFPRAIGVASRDPYLEVSRFLSIHRDKVPVALNTLRYFDGVNFAARAKVPALFSVGLMDTICPPSTVYGAFNAYAGADKEIVVYSYNDHEGGGSFQDRRQVAWLEGRL